MLVLVYGLVRSGHPDPQGLAGAGEPPATVRLVRSGPVAAAVSDVADVELGDAEAVGYLDVLVGLLRDGPVLPVRFGTVAPDEDAVRTEIVDPERDLLADRLDALDGLVEVRLDVRVDEEAGIRRVVAESPQLRRLVDRARTGGALDARIGLGEEISRALDAHRGVLADRVVQMLADLAVSHAVRLPDDVTLASHAFLVPAARLAEVDGAVQRLRADLGADYGIEYVGPLPAFDFIDGEPRRPEPAQGRWGW
ncbi:GvpL/GvpF family gas vesicle protein [Planosporangium thailandense]|uniref:GvpL/GvpF family gas vesicle protein n=1 Tax=Planosporangium thailandense TaxID=765197 RepID=A0ABX0XSW4_9ACTN|nr:GvpL/GvpF family gas vesicle protein [Planosporangium thailandense]NJC68329.1 GvpL/GvpF family gas vesicle protein [Planosporangium thailandense]